MKPSELLADPKAWTKGKGACDANGHPIDPESRWAVAWCVLGAAWRCYGGDPALYERHARYVEAFREETHGALDLWNDAPERTHAEVIALLQFVEKKLGL